MKIKIYQIVPERDKNRVMFVDSTRLLDLFGRLSPDKAIYDVVFDGEVSVSCEDVLSIDDQLEELFRIFNVDRKPDGCVGRSMSVSDIVEIDGELYFCDSIGFRKVQWAKEGDYNA